MSDNLGPILTDMDDVLSGVFISPPSSDIALLWYANGKYWLSNHSCYVKWQARPIHTDKWWRFYHDTNPICVTYEMLLNEFRYPKFGNIAQDAKDGRDYRLILSDDLFKYQMVASAASVLEFPVLLHIRKHQIAGEPAWTNILSFEPNVVLIAIRERLLQCKIVDDVMVVSTATSQFDRWPRMDAESLVAKIPLCDASAFDEFRYKLNRLSSISSARNSKRAPV